MERYRLDYDPRVDAAYIKIGSGKVVESTEFESEWLLTLIATDDLLELRFYIFPRANYNLIILQQPGSEISLLKSDNSVHAMQRKECVNEE